MPRTVVPPRRTRGPKGRASGGDSLPERLVKYIPGETLAFFVPTSSAIGSDRTALLTLVLVAGLAGTIGYLWLAGQKAKPFERPKPHFYVLAGGAFLVWAMGTCPDVPGLISLDRLAAGVILGVAVFVIPMIDEIINRLASAD